ARQQDARTEPLTGFAAQALQARAVADDADDQVVAIEAHRGADELRAVGVAAPGRVVDRAREPDDDRVRRDAELPADALARAGGGLAARPPGSRHPARGPVGQRATDQVRGPSDEAGAPAVEQALVQASGDPCRPGARA